MGVGVGKKGVLEMGCDGWSGVDVLEIQMGWEWLDCSIDCLFARDIGMCGYINIDDVDEEV